MIKTPWLTKYSVSWYSSLEKGCLCICGTALSQFFHIPKSATKIQLTAYCKPQEDALEILAYDTFSVLIEKKQYIIDYQVVAVLEVGKTYYVKVWYK